MDSQRTNFIKGVILGALVGVGFQLGGYLLVRGDRTEFGWVMFVLVPFVSGFAVSAVVRYPRRILACCLAGGLVTFSVLETAAVAEAKAILHEIFHFHPDMSPRQMDDGNIAILYNHPAINVVLAEFAKANWSEIDRNHQAALATSEVLITPQGQNKFDAFGKMALYGRCFMFMDAQQPEVVQVVRGDVQQDTRADDSSSAGPAA